MSRTKENVPARTRSDSGSWQCCHNCNENFENLEEALQHFVESCPELWCKRCRRAFKSEDAKDQHFIHNYAHWQCGVCEFDGLSVDAQERHWRKTGHKHECMGCRSFFEQPYYEKHMKSAHACTKCHKHLGDEIQRRKHELEHASDGTHKCIGRCGRDYPTLGGMYIHLESGSCESSINFRDVFKTFANHPKAEYLLTPDRKGVLQPIFQGEDPESCPFVCPGKGEKGCGEYFKFFSGFLQHAESGRCGWSFNKTGDKSMLKHMESHLFLDTAIGRIAKMEESTRAGIQVLAIQPENPAERAGAYLPDAAYLRVFFTDICKHIRTCLKEVSYTASTSSETPGTLKVRIPRAFFRDLGALERSYEIAMQGYGERVLRQLNPHGDIIIYFQTTKTSQTGLRFLKDIYKLINIFKLVCEHQAGKIGEKADNRG
ncbi:hypothetical protein ABW19_dt0201096 [Dactylella cylindrospora]|nr:hypothetical protein ABW19_dt0201096 [Dactylella cylindrospora]